MRILLLAVVVLLASCDTSVEPFQESGYYFSFGGLIDATVDTQFVRIGPLRDKAVVSPDPYPVTVTSTDLESGEESIWMDSVFVLYDGKVAHNFWSTADFQPGGRYRFTARTAEGRVSTAEVTLPDTAQIVVQTNPFDPVYTINVFRAEKLADLRLMYCGHIPGSGIQRVDVSLIDRVSEFSLGFTARVDPGQIIAELDFDAIVGSRLVAFAVGAEWPEFEELDEESLALPHVHSNVENGIGYLGAVATTTVDWGGSPTDPRCAKLLDRW